MESKATEEKIIELWRKLDFYSKITDKNKATNYSICELPNPSHRLELETLVNKIAQDIFIKFCCIKNIAVDYQQNWDYYSPIVERQVMNLMAEISIDAVKFRAEYRKQLHNNAKKINGQLRSLGVFVDPSNQQIGLRRRDETKIITSFNKLQEMEYIDKIVQARSWCPSCGKVLGAQEMLFLDAKRLAGYVKFPVSVGLEKFGKNLFFATQFEELWKIAGVSAIALRTDRQYVLTELGNDLVIFSEQEAKDFSVEGEVLNIIAPIEFNELIACRCIHPFLEMNRDSSDWQSRDRQSREVRVIWVDPDSVETAENGKTPGDIFPIVPAHDKMAHEIAETENLSFSSVLNHSGHLNESAGQFNAFSIYEAEKLMMLELDRRGCLISAQEQSMLRPHCSACRELVVHTPVHEWSIAFGDKLRNSVAQEYGDRYPELSWFGDSLRTSKAIQVLGDNPGSIPFPIFRCERCNEVLSGTSSLRAIRDVSSRRGSDVWLKAGSEALLSPDAFCESCHARKFYKESIFLDGQFVTLCHQLRSKKFTGKSDADRLENRLSGTVLYFCRSDLLKKWLIPLSFLSIILRHKLPFNEVKQIEPPKDILELEVDHKIIDCYDADVVRIFAISPELATIEVDDLLDRCQKEYDKIKSLLHSGVAELNSDPFALEPEEILMEIDRFYEKFQFYRAWQLMRDFIESRSSKLKNRKFFTKLNRRLAPIVPFLSEQLHEKIARSEKISSEPTSVFQC